jgi:hypothetical protein
MDWGPLKRHCDAEKVTPLLMPPNENTDAVLVEKVEPVISMVVAWELLASNSGTLVEGKVKTLEITVTYNPEPRHERNGRTGGAVMVLLEMVAADPTTLKMGWLNKDTVKPVTDVKTTVLVSRVPVSLMSPLAVVNVGPLISAMVETAVRDNPCTTSWPNAPPT